MLRAISQVVGAMRRSVLAVVALRAARSLRVLLSRTLVIARRANRIIALELTDSACRTELRSSRALLRSLTALRDALLLLERGLRTRDRAVVRRAERRIFAAGEDPSPTAAQSLEVFRGVCAPAG